MQYPVWARPKRDRYHFIKTMALVLAVVFFACWALAGVSHGDTSNKPLRFTENGTFQISIFEDLHFGEGMSEPNRYARPDTDT
jgi:hypothetical protein